SFGTGYTSGKAVFQPSIPWHPWHCAMRFWIVILLSSAAEAPSAASARHAKAKARRECMAGFSWSRGRRGLYRSGALEEGIERPRRAEVEALPQLHADRGELLRDLLGLDRFGDGLQAQARADLVHGLDHGEVERVARHALHERAVDLQPVQRELAHVIERREAAAEIVQHEAHAELGERLDQALGALHVGDRRGLGDLEVERLRR